MKDSIWTKLNSIKYVVFCMVFASTNVFMALGKITGLEYVSLMTLIVGIFTAGHEFTKSISEKYDCKDGE